MNKTLEVSAMQYDFHTLLKSFRYMRPHRGNWLP